MRDHLYVVLMSLPLPLHINMLSIILLWNLLFLFHLRWELVWTLPLSTVVHEGKMMWRPKDDLNFLPTWYKLVCVASMPPTSLHFSAQIWIKLLVFLLASPNQSQTAAGRGGRATCCGHSRCCPVFTEDVYIQEIVSFICLWHWEGQWEVMPSILRGDCSVYFIILLTGKLPLPSSFGACSARDQASCSEEDFFIGDLQGVYLDLICAFSKCYALDLAHKSDLEAVL